MMGTDPYNYIVLLLLTLTSYRWRYSRARNPQALCARGRRAAEGAAMVGLAGGEDTQGNTCDTSWGCGGIETVV